MDRYSVLSIIQCNGGFDGAWVIEKHEQSKTYALLSHEQKEMCTVFIYVLYI